jgi:hypothetical protein
VPANGQLPGSFTVPAGAFGLSLTFQSVALLVNSSFLIGPPTVVIYR